MARAKVFWTGRSQAVRLPKEFRFDTDEVSIRREGKAVVLEPVVKDWSWLDDMVGKMGDDFMKDGREQPPMPPDPDFGDLFR